MFAGAAFLSCCGGVKKLDGLTFGAGNCVGNPPATVFVMSGEFTQPFVILLKGKTVVQVWTKPGTLPAAAVTWKDEMVSKAMP
jgi:hypothetical protein